MNSSFTSPDELFKLARRLKVPLLWVGFKDEIPRLENGSGYILNLQSSDEGMGTHWTCFYISHDGRQAAYFDSFGSELPVEVEKALRKYKVYKTNKIIQNPASGFCGQYCLLFLLFICRFSSGWSLPHLIQAFENLWTEPRYNLSLLKARLQALLER